MKSPKRILLFEDSNEDALLLGRSLNKEWPDCELVWKSDEAGLQAALDSGGFDAIVSDFSLPGFNGMDALHLALQRCPDVPFIFVSGALEDDVAVRSLKAGATDYVLKDRLARLAPAIRRALNDTENRGHRRLMEEQLRHSEAQYRDLLEHASDLIQSITVQGAFLYVNRAWREALEYSEAELARLTFWEVLHPEYHEAWRDRMLTARPDESLSWELIFLSKYGKHLYVEGSASARFEAGKIAATRGVFHDVTDKRLSAVALKRSMRQYETLVNSVDGIVWQADLPNLRFTFVSRQAERLLGFPSDQWLGDPQFWQNHIHPDDRANAMARYADTSQDYQTFEYRMIAADGRVVWLRDIVSVVREESEPMRAQGIMVNITQRKLAEEARRDIQAKLERSNKILHHRNQEIQNFYHTLSHELKTPLTSAREFISILMDGLAGPLNATQIEYLGIARHSCDQLRACINDLLDATRLETGKLALDLKPVSLAALVKRVVAGLLPLAAEKQIELQQELDTTLPDAHLDEHRITQVITNLVANAIKYTPSRGEILVRTGTAPGHPDLQLFSVRDSGCGIIKDEQERIFDRLYQVKAGDATTEQGIGLGLYLCRELVQLHGGSISVESQSGCGSTFSVVVPRTQEMLRYDVLVIDDDPDMLDMLRHLFAAEHFSVRTAGDGCEGLKEMQRRPPDLVLLDLAMAEMNGPATLKEIRRHWGEIPCDCPHGLLRRRFDEAGSGLFAVHTPGQAMRSRSNPRNGSQSPTLRRHRPMEKESLWTP
jgi:PAS domain S-box-containing protein